jgi:hypothetical protein
MPCGSPKRTARAQRIVIRCVAFLLLGAIVNVAVAWSIGIIFNPPWFKDHVAKHRKAYQQHSINFTEVDQPNYSALSVSQITMPMARRTTISWADPGQVLAFGIEFPGEPAKYIPSWAPELNPKQREPTDRFHHAITWEYGWPWYAVGGYLYQYTDSIASPITGINRQYETGSAVVHDKANARDPNKRTSLKMFVYRPIWPGFAFNSIFYALILALLWFTPITLRRWRRLHTGRCPHCAYDLQHEATAGCPECGWNRAEHITS